uniref:Integrator complex subunit 10 n=1 Tax=Monodon monoceros TaxID=40151 RepID=A0A8C6BGC0_MONMO
MSAQGDCEFLVQRARELVQQDLWAAKAWLITACSLYPANFNIQVYLKLFLVGSWTLGRGCLRF